MANVKKVKKAGQNNTYKNKNDKKKDTKAQPKKKYKNPAFSAPGKTIICVLALLMLFSGLISLIILLVMNA